MDYEKAYGIQKRQTETLLKLVLRAVVSGPGRRDRYTRTAGISWDVLAEMMAELDRVGINWRGLRPDKGAKLPKGENGNG